MEHASQVLMAFSVWIAAAVIPLLPAIAIYKLFPDTKVAVSGPLSGLTLRTSGAFAVYVVVFLLTASLPYKVIDLIEANVSAAWNVKFKRLDLVGSKGQTISDSALMNQMQVSLLPEFFVVSGSGGWAKVPETDQKLPKIVFTVPGRGSKEIDLQNELDSSADVEINHARHEITLHSPITVRVHEDKAPYLASGEIPQPVTGELSPP